MTTKGWLDQPRADLAAQRILDAAETLYQEYGVPAVTMEDVAKAAGCSRATVYRYFDDRVALRTAYVHRETRRVAAAVGVAIATIDDPEVRIVEAIMHSVAAVRGRPALLAWFTSVNTAVTTELVMDSTVIPAVAGALFGAGGGADRSLRAAWLVRVTMSLLLFPAATEADERLLVQRFVAPALSGR